MKYIITLLYNDKKGKQVVDSRTHEFATENEAFDRSNKILLEAIRDKVDVVGIRAERAN